MKAGRLYVCGLSFPEKGETGRGDGSTCCKLHTKPKTKGHLVGIIVQNHIIDSLEHVERVLDSFLFDVPCFFRLQGVNRGMCNLLCRLLRRCQQTRNQILCNQSQLGSFNDTIQGPLPCKTLYLLLSNADGAM